MDYQKRKNNKTVCCLDGQVYMELPWSWDSLPAEIAAVKFPYRKKPQEIYASPEADRMLTLDLPEKTLQGRQVYPAIWEMQKMISHLYPESIWETARLTKSRESTAGYFLFVTGGIKHDTCHAMFVLPVHDRMMMGGYHFPAGQVRENKAAFLNILKSIHTDRDAEEGVSGENGIRGQSHPGL